MTEKKLVVYSLTEKGMAETEPTSWGGARPGAGRPRTESLDAVECLFLADLLDQQQERDGEDYRATSEKLRRIAERITRTGR